MNHPLCKNGRRWLAVILTAAVVATGLFGCEDSLDAETAAFEAAEVDYRQGNYDDAIKGYQAFLERYPQSPLAPSAEIRLRSIHHEVSSLMEQTGSPRPSYHGLDGEQSPPPLGAPADSDDSIR